MNFPATVFPFGETEPQFVDVENNLQSRLGLPEGDAVDLLAVSPWHDEEGVGQVIGRWSSRSGKDCGMVFHEFGLARYTFPEGKPLNRIPTQITPTDHICWLPGTRTKVLFTAGDGSLYRFSFEDSTEPDATKDGCDTRPHPLAWDVATGSSDGRVVMSDPYWPEDCGFGGRMVVSLSMQTSDKDGIHATSPRLWWLQLDRDATSIQEAGPLLAGDAESNPNLRQRNPTFIRSPSGEVLVAFLERAREREPWRLVVAHVQFALDASGEKLPRVSRDDAVVLEEDCDFTNLAFSHDARWLYFVSTRRSPGQVRRVAVPRTNRESVRPAQVASLTR